MTSVLNCTPRVGHVRALRAAAFAPYVTGLTLLILAVPLSWFVDHDAKEAAEFLSASILLILTASLIKRGVFIAALVLAMGLVGTVIGMLATVRDEMRLGDPLITLLSLLVFAVPCWLALRAVAASWQLRRVPWRSGNVAGIRSSIAELPRDRRLIAALWPLASAFAMYGAGAVLVLAVGIATRSGLFAGLAFLPFALAGSRLMQRARQTLALRVAEIRASDPRLPVLLLRSFADDMLELDPKFEYFSSIFRKRLTLEEFVVSQVMTLGPVVALGKPTEELSPLGAAREYVFGPGWQQRVSSLLDECSWVVAILGGGEGLRWEYEQVVDRGLTGRFILVVPPATPDVFQQRWAIFQRAFPAARGADLSLASQMGGPLCAVFPDGAEPLLFCSKYQTETAYGVVFAMLLARLTSQPR